MAQDIPRPPQRPISPTSPEEFPEWALRTARGLGLSKAADEYPEQLIRAAAMARAGVEALEEDMPGIALLPRPAWSLTK